MHLKNPLLFGLMAILLLGGTITPVLSQSSSDVGVVINEVEMNPAGSDAGIGVGGSGNESKSVEGASGAQEYVELYNSSSQKIDLSGWLLVPSAEWKTYTIPENTMIEPDSFLAFTHVNFWFNNFGDTVSLYDNSGNLIDETPLLVDKDDSATSWQRLTDGFDNDLISDWELKRISPKSSNGKLTTTVDSTSAMIDVITDKDNYSFGDSVTISGTVSEYLYNNSPLGSPEIIQISINGPTYFKNIALFPERDLEYSTTLDIREVLGFNVGTYLISVTYGDVNTNTSFDVIPILDESASDVSLETVELFTDKESYIPGEEVILSAETNSLIEYGGLDYVVINPEGNQVFAGTIFQNDRFSTVYQHGGEQIYPFSTSLMMTIVNPVFGTYEVQGTYKSQNPVYYNSEDVITTKTSFNLVEDVKEDTAISLSTDKKFYTVGDTIKVTGRSNHVWTESLNLEVMQTGVLSRNMDDIKGQHLRPDPFSLQDIVRLNGDGTFDFEFKLVESVKDGDEYNHVLGDYRVHVSGFHGKEAFASFQVVDNPESFVDVRTPLGLKIDKSEYVLGTGMTITGKVLDYSYVGNQKLQFVEFTFTGPDGKPVMSQDRQTQSRSNFDYEADSPNDKLRFKAIPDTIGGFSMQHILHVMQFDYGTYTVTATHPYSKVTESVQFDIISAQSTVLPESEEEQEPIVVEICKSDRTSVSEILKDLKVIRKGIPPSMESVVCSDDLTFYTGEKLVIKGKVIPKNPTSLDQSSTRTSGQTEQGHSYSTNYAQSIMNYVLVSIPYPMTMAVSPDAAWKTTPNEGENYTGGGGSGEGGGYRIDDDGNVARGEVEGRDSSGSTGYDGQAVLQKQKLLLTDMNFKAYPDDEGNFAGVFDLRAGVFKSGIYKISADYYGYNFNDKVSIIDNSLKGGLPPKISLDLDRDEYFPGEIVQISGMIENIYYYDSVSIIIEPPNISNINCLVGQQCGLGNTEKKIRVQDSTSGPKFFWNYKIPKDSSSVGTYTINVDTHFGKLEKEFFVVNQSDSVTPSPESIPTSKKIIDKFNRISDNEIQIQLGEKSSDESTLMPRVLQGSLFTSARGEESDVNLRITTSGGQCIIGQDSDCLVTESTRKPGAIYSIVSIDDVNYKIRYSGNDVRLEKFSIVPAESGTQIDIDNWNVEIIKDEQPSRFYYKVSYVALE